MVGLAEVSGANLSGVDATTGAAAGDDGDILGAAVVD